MQHIERAILDLRRGLPVVIRSAGGLHLAASLENLDHTLSNALPSGIHGPARLVLTRQRIAHLSMAVESNAAAIVLDKTDRFEDCILWACAPDARWPVDRRPIAVEEADRAALALLRHGMLIPAAVVARPPKSSALEIERRVARGDWLSVDVADVFAHRVSNGSLVHRVSEANVPLDASTCSRFLVFREAEGLREHLAVLIGHQADWPDPVPVRLHSACLTGDLFGSLRCDCGAQLKSSVRQIGERGGGVLLYIAQEGRGIGLANKMRAYQMQEDGLDTVDADRVLGFGRDERDYAVAREILVQIDVTRIDLLTNNPAKLAALDGDPIRVARRSSVYGRLTPENERYLTTKAQRAGHWLDTLLGETAQRGG